MSDSTAVTTIDGVRRSAVLLMVLQESASSEILKQFQVNEVQVLAQAMGHLRNVDKEEITETLRDFLRTVRDQSLLGESSLGGERIRKVLVSALGADKAADVISKIRILERRAGGLKSLNRKEPAELAAIAKMQHPQIAAALLSQLDQAKCSTVLQLLPEESQRDILVRVARLETVSESAVEELKRIVEQYFDEESEIPEHDAGGPKLAAAMLNSLSKEEKERVYAEIREIDEELADSIEDNMFVFDDLLKVDDRGIQSLLAEVPGQTLTMALKGAEDSTKEKLLNNMSKRAAQMLRDDLEVGGPVKLSEVETAQKEIVKVVRRMIDDGSVVVRGMGGGEQMVG